MLKTSSLQLFKIIYTVRNPEHKNTEYICLDWSTYLYDLFLYYISSLLHNDYMSIPNLLSSLHFMFSKMRTQQTILDKPACNRCRFGD